MLPWTNRTTQKQNNVIHPRSLRIFRGDSFYARQEEFVSFSIRSIILGLKIYHTVNRFFLPETTIDKQSMTRYNIRKEQMFDTWGGI